ncbi:MAG: protein kinase [Myxococcales bacterium]|nr:protein kinase [Myxococcales bacterium]
MSSATTPDIAAGARRSPSGIDWSIATPESLEASISAELDVLRPHELIGAVVADRYTVTGHIGSGGMGDVYVAEHRAIGKQFALKVLAPQHALRKGVVRRFLQEARAASMIRHRNVVDIVDFGQTPQGSVFYAMEYLEGETLASMLRREGRLPWSRVREIIIDICNALDAAHAKGVVHRDVKPGNCVITRDGSGDELIKVVDFGIAKVIDDTESASITDTGVILGTPAYMSPEQSRGERLDARTDLYSLGVILYELVTGRVPFEADTKMGVLMAHILKPPPLPRLVAPDAEIPAEVETIIIKALSKSPEVRYQTAGEFADAVLGVRVSDGAPAGALIRSATARTLAGALGVLLLMAAAFSTAWFLRGGPNDASAPAVADAEPTDAPRERRRRRPRPQRRARGADAPPPERVVADATAPVDEAAEDGSSEDEPEAAAEDERSAQRTRRRASKRAGSRRAKADKPPPEQPAATKAAEKPAPAGGGVFLPTEKKKPVFLPTKG